MATLACINAFRDVNRYTSDLLLQHERGVEVFATYRKEWNDEFGARGWKLNATIGDAEIIASTRQTGQRINTSVFVHDVLDHFLCGFGVSGHRSEAMALVQLAKRTGSSPGPDFKQMVTEDIMHGRVNGETLLTFLPQALRALLPSAQELTDKETVLYLEGEMGRDTLVATLVDHFFKLGSKGNNHAIESWSKLGLVADNAANTGIALQALLEIVDFEAERSAVDRLDASIVLNNEDCIFITTAGGPEFSASVYHAEIAPGLVHPLAAKTYAELRADFDKSKENLAPIEFNFVENT